MLRSSAKYRLMVTMLCVATIAVGTISVTSTYAASTDTFSNPSILVNKAQLNFIKAKYNAGQQPWKPAIDQMKTDIRGKTTYTPKPVARLLRSQSRFSCCLCSIPSLVRHR